MRPVQFADHSWTSVSEKLIATELDFFTDASHNHKLGFGIIFGKKWTKGTWEENFIRDCNPSITYLELYGVAIGILLWAKELKNKRVVLFCDNQSVVKIIKKASSPHVNCMVLIRIITFTSLKHNVSCFVRYVKSADNVLPDALSRNDMTRFWRINVEQVPQELPSKIWPIRKIWKHDY